MSFLDSMILICQLYGSNFTLFLSSFQDEQHRTRDFKFYKNLPIVDVVLRASLFVYWTHKDIASLWRVCRDILKFKMMGRPKNLELISFD